MMRLNLFLVTGLVTSLLFSKVEAFSVVIDTGNVMVVRDDQQKTFTDTCDISYGDKVKLDEESRATVIIENDSRMLLQGPLSISISDDSSILKVSLAEGQILLDRNQPYQLDVLIIESKDFVFEPLGTLAAVKIAQSGNPTTAVVKGSMKMVSPEGEELVVEEGKFGSVGPQGDLFSGDLADRAIESLKNWAEKAADINQKTVNDDDIDDISEGFQENEAQNNNNEIEKNENDEPESNESEKASVNNNSSDDINEAKKTDKTPEHVQNEDNKKAQENVSDEQEKAKESEKSQESAAPVPQSPKWEIGAGVVTVNNEQWTRLAVGVDVPIWKFGVFFDVEFFIDSEGRFSNKGWDFKDEPLEAITRKIRYIRFGQEEDPLFIKFGGLSSVTFGYGFILDRFTNMLHYPDQKLLGLQFNLNDISPIGISLQTLVADFKDFNDDGGLLGARLAVTPLKMTSIPIVNRISIGGTYVKDLNQYAPARKWEPDLSEDERILVELRDGGFLKDSLKEHLENSGIDVDGKLDKIDEDNKAKTMEDDFGLIGGDIGIPLISTKFLGVDLYGQAGLRDDGVHGWGIGAPGLALKIWRLWGNIEYRKTKGRFTPGYFDTYYLDERITRTPDIIVKEDLISDEELNGIYGKLGFNISNVLIIDGTYQYLVGDNDFKDQRFEATSSVGDLILQKVPKLNKAEVYYYKSNIGVYDEKFFEKSEFQYMGYRIGFEITQGASLIWDSRYGYKRKNDGKLESDNFISVLTAITF